MSRALALYPLYRVPRTIPFLRALSKTYPVLLKFFGIILFLINVRSWPLTWHLRVWRPVFQIKLRQTLAQLSCIFQSRRIRNAENERFLESLSPVGMNPLDITSPYKTWAGPDDCDFNFHLSNSSYAKNLDAARFKTSATFFPALFTCGGFVALGATHYSFLREIPICAKYEMISNLLCWDNKWIYIVTRFITRGQNRKSNLPKLGPSTSNINLQLSNLELNLPDLGPGSSGLKHFISTEALNAESQGATLNCIAISRMCFKFGRITAPPSLVLACEGFTNPLPKSHLLSCDPNCPLSTYSHANPPPHYKKHVLALRNPDLDNGSLKRLQKFLKGGWRDVPEGERWWEEALGGALEERRKKNMELVDGVRSGMDNLREMYFSVE
ncbi:unnamed protein product [Somion occarium]|uniref:Uncharacterized protein n=1 Tax=Somion occarium TaxID=3059160 RepID=A0ABP1DRR0_9APHY